VSGITYPRQVSSVLDQHVLKAASSADQRDVPLARFPHDRVGRLGIAVWAAGPNDEGRCSAGDLGRVTNPVSGHDPDIDGDPPYLGRMSEGGEGRAVVPVVGRQIYQHRDDYGAHR